MDSEGQFVLISWEALAFVFAILPGIAGLAYCYACGRTRERPTWSGYWSLLRTANKAKSEAYRKTAGLFSSPSSPKWTVGVLAWLFMLFIVAVVSPSRIITLSCLAICVPGSGIAYLVGRATNLRRDTFHSSII